MLAVQEFISSFDNMETAALWLKKKVGVIATQETILGTSIWQLRSAKGAEDLISRESDGLILDDKGEILCMVPKRPILIANMDDERLDHSDMLVVEKKEGVRVMVFFLRDSWHVATEESAAGQHIIKIEKNISSTVRFEVISKLNVDYGSWHAVFDSADDDNLCYIFNYNWPYREGVDIVSEPTLTLETIINRITGLEEEQVVVYEFAKMFGFDVLTELSLIKKEEMHKVLHTFSTGIEFRKRNGERFFLSNRLYNSLYVAKIAGAAILPVHILNIVRNIRNDVDMKMVKTKYPKLLPMVDILMSAEIDLAVALMNEASGTAEINCPGGVLTSQKGIITEASKLMKSKDFAGARKAIQLIRPDKIVAYATITSGRRMLDAMEKIKGD